jgi:hypothetical protein
MTPVVPVPQTIAGYPVVAAIAVAPRPGDLPWQFIVICQQDHVAPGRGHYVTWRVGSRDGHQWAAENARQDLTWPEAVASFTSRASLPTPTDSH